MKGDFTRDTFDPKNFFSQVLMQQGRVTLDADFNEQGSILLHYLRMLARDLIGPYAAPSQSAGFKLSANAGEIVIGAGRYYVDGILVETEGGLYTEQPYFRVPEDDGLAKILDTPDQAFWIYLDVWERLVTSLENDAIREKALGGPDTCTRAQVVWQVKWLPVEPGYEYPGYEYPGYEYPGYPFPGYPGYGYDQGYVEYGYADYGPPCDGPLEDLISVSPARLAARVDPGPRISNACVMSPDSKYRGAENQLYRIEIHRGGAAGQATFKWSRDNGSVVTSWINTTGNDLQVANARGFSAGNWVELSDDIAEQQGEGGVMVKLTKVESGVLTLDPSLVPSGGLPVFSELKNPKIRRWDQIETEDVQLDGGAVPIIETPATEDADKASWVDLEDGVQVAFEAQADLTAPDQQYRAGDYWLIPARVNSGNIEWPAASETGKMSLIKPRGVVHHYAPLGFAFVENNELNFKSCVCQFQPLGDCFRSAGRTFGGQLIGADGPRVVVERAPAKVAKSKRSATRVEPAPDAPAVEAAPAASKSAKKSAKRRKTKTTK